MSEQNIDQPAPVKRPLPPLPKQRPASKFVFANTNSQSFVNKVKYKIFEI
jgi:hypothetical protein